MFDAGTAAFEGTQSVTMLRNTDSEAEAEAGSYASANGGAYTALGFLVPPPRIGRMLNKQAQGWGSQGD